MSSSSANHGGGLGAGAGATSRRRQQPSTGSSSSIGVEAAAAAGGRGGYDEHYLHLHAASSSSSSNGHAGVSGSGSRHPVSNTTTGGNDAGNSSSSSSALGGVAKPAASAPTTTTPFQSCDACRGRKIRCVWDDEQKARRAVERDRGRGSGGGQQGRHDEQTQQQQQQQVGRGGEEGEEGEQDRCMRCSELKLACTFQYTVKKRGPPKGVPRARARADSQTDSQAAAESAEHEPTISKRSNVPAGESMPMASMDRGGGSHDGVGFAEGAAGRGGGGGGIRGRGAAGGGASKRRRLTDNDAPPSFLEGANLSRTGSAMGVPQSAAWGSPPLTTRPRPTSSTSWPSLGAASAHLQTRQYTNPPSSLSHASANFENGSVPVALLPKSTTGTIAGGFDPQLSAAAAQAVQPNGTFTPNPRNAGGAVVGDPFAAIALAPHVHGQGVSHVHAISPGRTSSSSSSTAAPIGLTMPPAPSRPTQPNEAYGRPPMMPPTSTSPALGSLIMNVPHATAGFGSDSGWLEPPALSSTTSDGDLAAASLASSHRKPMIGRNSWTRGDGESDEDDDAAGHAMDQGAAWRQATDGAWETGLELQRSTSGQALSRKRERHGSDLEAPRTKLTQARLEDVLSRSDAEQMCELYIKYLWHLLPAIHVGSFRSSFAERQDESDPVFLAVILAVVGAAMVAMPKAWLPIEYGKIRRTLEACVDLSTGIILSMEELPPNTTTMMILYLNTQSYFNLTRRMSQYALWGQVLQHYHYMRLYDPAAYVGLSTYEREMRLRVYWLAYGADKSMACLCDQPMAIRSVEYGPVDFCQPLDDPQSVNDPASEPTPQISGFILISRIFAIHEEVMGLYRSRRFQMAHEDVLYTISRLGALRERAQRELAYAPAALRIKLKPITSSAEADMDRLRLFFDDHGGSSLDPFLVAQANCYVTATWVRYLISQCTRSLVRQSGITYVPYPREAEETPERICRDLLDILHSLPIECIASNGMPLVEKVRYIATGLLQLEPSSPGQVISDDSQTLLLDFLVLITEIERNFVIPSV